MSEKFKGWLESFCIWTLNRLGYRVVKAPREACTWTADQVQVWTRNGKRPKLTETARKEEAVAK